MIKKYLKSSMALLALCTMVAGCKDDSYTQADATKHAEQVLGVTIGSTQDWNMTTRLTASITVNLDLDQKYTVVIYDENPLFNKNAIIYAQETAEEGKNTVFNFSIPSALKRVYVAAYDSKLRSVVQSVNISGNVLKVYFGEAEAAASRRATEADCPAYAKTVADYLDGLTEAEMSKYNPFTDSDIDSQGHIFGSSTSNARRRSGRRAGQSVNATFYYKVQPGYNPADGESQYLYMGNEPIAKITYGGTGNAATESTLYSNMEAKITRQYIIIKSLVNGSGGITFYHDTKTANNNKLMVDNITTNTNVNNNTIWNGDYYLNAPPGGQSYKYYFSNGSPITFYGIQYYANGSTIEDTDSDEPGGGGDEPGGGSTTGGKHYLVEAGTTITKQFHITTDQMNGAVVYVKGKLNLGTNYTLNGVTVVVASGGEVILNGTVNMSTLGRFVVMGGGKITGTDGSTLTVTNGSKCYNAGSITYNGELNVNGSDFYNCGTINVGTLRDTSGGKITNFGSITAVTNAGAADAYNCEWINACSWKFTENAGIGTLTMLENSYLEVGGVAEFNQSTQKLYDLSHIKVGTLYLNSTTFEGPMGYGMGAIIQAGRVSVNQGADLGCKYNVYWDWSTKNLVNHQLVADYNCTVDNGYTFLSYILNLNLKYTTESSSPIRIPAGECTGAGYNPGGGGGSNIIGTPAVWSYAFEDSWMADYDMNDVVVKVQENGSDKLNITLCCTGATYNLFVYYNTTPLFGGREVHKVLGAEGKFINTGDPSNEKFAVRDAVTETIKKPANFDPFTFDIWIKSPEKSQIKLAEQGEDPHAIMVPGDWKWPTEWTPIKEAYPDFVGFAADETHNTNTDWYNNCVESKVY